MRVLFNSDGGKGALFHFEPPITPEQLCRVVDDVRDTQVDAFLQCINFGDDNFLYPSRVARVYDGSDVAEFEKDSSRRWALNVRSLLDAGWDPLQLWADRTHELGMAFWPSMRMNDIHKDWVDRWPSLRSDWEKEHQHLLIGDRPPQVPGVQIGRESSATGPCTASASESRHLLPRRAALGPYIASASGSPVSLPAAVDSGPTAPGAGRISMPSRAAPIRKRMPQTEVRCCRLAPS